MPPVHPKEMANVLQLDLYRRFDHFIKTVVGTRMIWSLGNSEGYVLYGDDEGVEHVPMWPAPEYAQLCAQGDWSDCVPREIPLDSFLERWVPGMTADERRCTVFPTPESSGGNIEPLKLREHLLDAISRIEYLD